VVLRGLYEKRSDWYEETPPLAFGLQQAV